MFQPRVIPVLLVKDGILVKSTKFKNLNYIGDPINAVRIFNDLNSDELILLDIGASRKKKTIPFDIVKEVSSETNMPFSVGGGIKSINDIKNILSLGAEKVVIGQHAINNPDFIRIASSYFGSSTIVVCIDVKKDFFGNYRVCVDNGRKKTKYSPIEFSKLMESNGAGEIILQSIDKDGTMQGYDIKLTKLVSDDLTIPVVCLGGAGKIDHLVESYQYGNASALSAGSLFIYQDMDKGVLINYHSSDDIDFNAKILTQHK